MTHAEVRKKLPIPLTCQPQIQEGKCIHGFDNGACKLPGQFMCPYYLWYEKTYPDKVGEVPKEMVDVIEAEKPLELVWPVAMLAEARKKMDGEHGKDAGEPQRSPKPKKALKSGGKKRSTPAKAEENKGGRKRARIPVPTARKQRTTGKSRKK
jgi:hypothetical protein